MKHAVFRLYAELNDFVPADKRSTHLVRGFELSASVKDMIEALGVPHTEVEFILANGIPVDFSYLVRNGDRIGVYPAFRSFVIPPEYRLRPTPRSWCFVADSHLGRLAAYLRMAGFDTLYRNDYADSDLARISSSEGRILLTRDRGLLKRGEVVHGYFLRETAPKRQLEELIRRYALLAEVAPFRRCIRCNHVLENAPKDSVKYRLPPDTERCYEEFARCPSCGGIYWAGSHYRHMRTFLERMFAELKTGNP